MNSLYSGVARYEVNSKIVRGLRAEYDTTDYHRAYAAAARRKVDRPIEARIDSAVQASRYHYERTGRCLYITRAEILADKLFEELEEEEQFFDPQLILPDGFSRHQLYQEHLHAMQAAEACFPLHQTAPLVNGHISGTVTPHVTNLPSQSSAPSLQGSQSRNPAMLDQTLSDDPTTVINDSDPVLASPYLFNTPDSTASQNNSNGMGLENLSTANMTLTSFSTENYTNLTSEETDIIDFQIEEEINFDEWICYEDTCDGFNETSIEEQQSEGGKTE
jgi:hypothetical protein